MQQVFHMWLSIVGFHNKTKMQQNQQLLLVLLHFHIYSGLLSKMLEKYFELELKSLK